MVGTLYLPLVLSASVVGMGFALFSWLHRESPGARPLTLFLVGASFWATAEGLTVALGGIEAMALWTQIALSVSVVPPLAWLLLVVEYTAREGWLTRGRVAALFVEPLVFVAFIWTNDSHGYLLSNPELPPVGMFRAYSFDFGLVFWGHHVYSTLLLAAGFVLLARLMLRTGTISRWQSTALLAAIVLPMISTTAYVFGLLPSGLDPNGVVYILAGTVLSVGIHEKDLFSFAPVTRDVGRQAVFSEIEDAILMLDDTDRIIDANPTAERLLDTEDELLWQPIGAVEASIADALATTAEGDEVELEIDGKLRYYDLSVTSVERGYGTITGRVISLREVTRRRQQEQRLDVLNRLLRHNLRNELNLVRGKIELTKARIDNGDENLDEAIAAVDDIVARSNKVGKLSRLLDAEASRQIDIATELRGEQRTGGFGSDDAAVDLDLPAQLTVRGGESLLAVFEELVSNGIEHNDSERPRVEVAVDPERSTDSHVVVSVSDNGPGIDQQEVQTLGEGRETPLQHSSGIGLWTVHWIVRRAGGDVSFRNTDDGCTVSVRLPRADEASEKADVSGE